MSLTSSVSGCRRVSTEPRYLRLPNAYPGCGMTAALVRLWSGDVVYTAEIDGRLRQPRTRLRCVDHSARPREVLVDPHLVAARSDAAAMVVALRRFGARRR
jgi:hypothetical protein